MCKRGYRPTYPQWTAGLCDYASIESCTTNVYRAREPTYFLHLMRIRRTAYGRTCFPAHVIYLMTCIILSYYIFAASYYCYCSLLIRARRTTEWKNIFPFTICFALHSFSSDFRRRVYTQTWGVFVWLSVACWSLPSYCTVMPHKVEFKWIWHQRCRHSI